MRQVQNALKIFDATGDGTIEPAELARAGELYVQSKNQVARLTKLAIVLISVLAVVLGIGAALTSAVSTPRTVATGWGTLLLLLRALSLPLNHPPSCLLPPLPSERMMRSVTDKAVAGCHSLCLPGGGV